MNLLLIFSILFSSLFGGEIGAECVSQKDEVVFQAKADSQDKQQDYRQSAILPIRTARLSTEDSSVTSCVRSTNSGRRVQQGAKFSFRIIKAGKVVDRIDFYLFQTSILQFQSGIFSIRRYIHVICQLLI